MLSSFRHCSDHGSTWRMKIWEAQFLGCHNSLNLVYHCLSLVPNNKRRPTHQDPGGEPRVRVLAFCCSLILQHPSHHTRPVLQAHLLRTTSLFCVNRQCRYAADVQKRAVVSTLLRMIMPSSPPHVDHRRHISQRRDVDQGLAANERLPRRIGQQIR